MRDKGRPDFTVEPPARSRFGARLALARFALTWERVWPAVWPAAFVVGVFLALALFDVPGWLSSGGAAALLGLAVAALIVTLALAVRDLRLPTRRAAQRRLETASGLTHRPLAALDDTLASSDDPATVALWHEHQARMAAAARDLRVGAPHAGLLRRDPYALRFALGLLLLLGVIDAGGDAPARILRALNPALTLGGVTATPVALDIWISPPQYTGLPPQFLSTASTATVGVPIGSTVIARVHDGGERPALVIDGHAIPMTKIDRSDYKGETTIKVGTHLAVRQGWSTLGTWPIRIIPDRPPTIAFARPPERTAVDALHLEYDAKDDYGVAKVTALITRPDDPGGQTLALNLPLPDQHLKNVQGSSFNDLTANPWAGMRVHIQLEAADALGQTGKSEIREFVLPERVFHNPVARAIIDERKELTRDPGDREPVADALEDLSARPALYNNDMVAFLGMRVAADRLMLDRDADAIASVQQLMWDTAVRIEDGGTRLEQEALRQSMRSMRSLQNALARNAPASEIDRLMQQLQQQIDRYLQALAQRTQRQNPQAATMPFDSSHMLTSQDLQQILNRARELARLGDPTQASQMLAELQDLLENLRSARTSATPGAAGALNAMQNLTQRQERLLDQTFRQSHNPGGRSNGAAEQEALRRMLGDMARNLGKSGVAMPPSLRRADRAMGEAAGALRRGQAAQAIGPQTDAVDALQQAARTLAQQMAGGSGAPGDGEQPQVQRDPFGRLLSPSENNGGYGNGGPLRMGKSQDYRLDEAKQILDELRRRAGEPDRPAVERQYIDRLLQQF